MEMTVNWAEAFKPLIEKYKGRKHPLEYKNRYQLVVMTVLSAQDSDKHINQVAIKFFEAFPSMKELAETTPEQLLPYLDTVRNFGNKIKWLISMARAIQEDANIPHTMEKLTELSGIGRKSASVIIRESGDPAEGIIVDLHVVRVAPRLGVVTSDKPDKIEKELLKLIPKDDWGEIGMAISFLGREICRPTNPHCDECPMIGVCNYYTTTVSKKKKKPKK